MRIIAGKYKNKKIYYKENKLIRPTLQKTKKSIFDLAEKYIIGARVLDLFAGSGSMSCEFISWGASKVIAIDQSQDAIAMISKNKEALELENLSFYKRSYESAVKYFQKNNEKFDFIFLDPPYEKININELIMNLISTGVLEKDGKIMVEESKRIDINGEFEKIIEKNYGDSNIYIIRSKNV